jgi:hypothetical protein
LDGPVEGLLPTPPLWFKTIREGLSSYGFYRVTIFIFMFNYRENNNNNLYQFYLVCTRFYISAYKRNYSYPWLFTESLLVAVYKKYRNKFSLFLESSRDYFVPVFHKIHKCLSYYIPGLSALNLSQATFDLKLVHFLFLRPWAHVSSY